MLKMFKHFFLLGALSLSSFVYCLDDSVNALQLKNTDQEIEAARSRRTSIVVFNGEVLGGRLKSGSSIPDGTPAEVIPFLIGPNGERQDLDPIPGVFIDHKLHTVAGRLHIPFTFDPERLQFGTYYVGVALKAAINEITSETLVTVALRVIADVQRNGESTLWAANLRYNGTQRLDLNISPIEVVVPIVFTKELLENGQ